MNRVADLWIHGDMSVLGRCSAVDVSSDDMRNCVKVVEMDPLIETYRQVYENDLEDRLGIKHDKLQLRSWIQWLDSSSKKMLILE